jgi:hypothetical protein
MNMPFKKKSAKIQVFWSIFLLSLFIGMNGCLANDENEFEEPQNESLTYYVDANTGNDDNSGKSPGDAFASLKNISGIELLSGTKVLLKSGTKYQGPIVFAGSGTNSQPIIISTYGGEEKPLIEGKGVEKYAVKIYNSSYLELKNIEITNTGDEPEAGRRGVIVEAKDCNVSKHIILDNLFIHDVNGSLVKKNGGGSAILWRNHGNNIKTKFDSLIIENCYIKDCTRNAINSKSGYCSRDKWHPSTNVIIRNNLIEGVPGDGIVPIGTKGALIEHNIMRDCPDNMPLGDAAAGIWPWSSDNTLIQFNEVSGHKAKWDAQGFDSDWNCQNTTIQYNYSHDNYGGFLLICNNGGNYESPINIGTINTIVRYNISVNDGIRPYESDRRGYFSPTMHISGPVENNIIHSNIIIVPEKSAAEIDRTIVQMDNWGGPWPFKSIFYKNYFALTNKGEFDYGESSNTFAKENIITDKDFGLSETNSDEIPEWAKPYTGDIDSGYVQKLIDKFFKDDNKIKEVLEDMISN